MDLSFSYPNSQFFLGYYTKYIDASYNELVMCNQIYNYILHNPHISFNDFRFDANQLYQLINENQRNNMSQTPYLLMIPNLHIPIYMNPLNQNLFPTDQSTLLIYHGIPIRRFESYGQNLSNNKLINGILNSDLNF